MAKGEVHLLLEKVDPERGQLWYWVCREWQARPYHVDMAWKESRDPKDVTCKRCLLHLKQD